LCSYRIFHLAISGDFEMAIDTLNLADHSGASVARQRISGILWHELHPWASTPPVRELNERVTFEGAGPS